MKARILTGALAVAGALALTGCTEPESGTVEELDYEPASFYTSQSCTYRYDSKGRYQGQTCTPYTTYVPECYDVDYYDAETDTSGDDCVSPELFEALRVGAEYWKGMGVSDVA